VKNLIFAIIVFLSFVLGWYLAQPDFNRKVEPEKRANTLGVEHAKKISTSPSNTAQWNATPISTKLFALFDKENRRLTSNELLQALQLIQQVSFSQAETLVTMVSQSKTINERNNTKLLTFIAGRMAEIDIIKSIHRANKLVNSKQKITVINALIIAWSKQDPEQAIQWLMDNKGIIGLPRSFAITLVIEHLVKVDFTLANSYILQMPQHDQLAAVLGAAVSGNTKDEFLILRDIAKDLGPQALLSFDKEWLKKSPRLMAQWMSNTMQMDDAFEIKNDLYSAFAKEDLVDATKWYRENVSDIKFVISLGNVWDFVKPEKYQKIFDWIRNEPIFKDIYQRLIPAAAEKAPDLVYVHLIQHATEPKDIRIHKSAYRVFLETDSALAAKLLKTSVFASNKDFIDTTARIRAKLTEPCERASYCF